MVDLDELRVYRFKFDGCLDDRIIIELKRIECTILSGLQFINDSVNNQLDAFPAQWKVKFLQSGSVNKPTVNLMVESG